MIDAVAVSPLRQRMIEDMTIRRFGEHTQRDYVRQVREFTAFLGLPPDRAEPEDLRRYQLHLASLGASYARMNLACTALRFFFHVTLGRTGFGDRMARIPTPDRLPVVLDTQEVALLLAHLPVEPHFRADLDGAVIGHRVAPRNRQGLGEVPGLDDDEAAEVFLGLHVGTVGGRHLAVAAANDRGRLRLGERQLRPSTEERMHYIFHEPGGWWPW